MAILISIFLEKLSASEKSEWFISLFRRYQKVYLVLSNIYDGTFFQKLFSQNIPS